MHQNVHCGFISIIRHDLAQNQCAIAIHAHQTFFQTNGSINLPIQLTDNKLQILHQKMKISVDNHSIQMAQFHPHTNNINKIYHKNEYELLFFFKWRNGKK